MPNAIALKVKTIVRSDLMTDNNYNTALWPVSAPQHAIAALVVNRIKWQAIPFEFASSRSVRYAVDMTREFPGEEERCL